MARQKQASFKMKGHTLPGINQKSETAIVKDGRSPSSAFQMAEPGDSPLDINFKKMLGALNPIKGMKKVIGGTKSLLQGDVKGAFGKLKPGIFGGGGGGGGDDLAGGGGGEDAEAGAELLKAEAKEAMSEGQV